jgi:glycosyltransferase involved in cell wall biosynthesis
MPYPLLTVVTPSYNQGHFIRATIESVLSQDYPNIEYIIMDGGSTDETASVVKDYASRVRFISEKDRGQSHAINKGFQMARGSILSWLNSDDLYLPGAARKAIDAWRSEPAAGAVYGEGYLIDRAGNTTSRFPCTEPFNLWKLVHLSDYVLQQTVYFRKDVLDRVGYLDEDLHFVMDWDILIRIGMQHPLLYVPEYMGCLREYPEAKSFAGGMRRAREIREMLQRHTGRRLSPGYVVYGLDTYQKIWCDRIERLCGPVKTAARTLQSAVRFAAGTVIARTIHHSQGLYSDGWASRVLRYMLPPEGETFAVEGTAPGVPDLQNQVLRVYANGRHIGSAALPVGDFRVTFDVPPELRGRVLDLTISASRWHVPSRFGRDGDRRRLAYLLKSIRWVAPSGSPDGLIRTAYVGI